MRKERRAAAGWPPQPRCRGREFIYAAVRPSFCSFFPKRTWIVVMDLRPLRCCTRMWILLPLAPPSANGSSAAPPTRPMSMSCAAIGGARRRRPTNRKKRRVGAWPEKYTGADIRGPRCTQTAKIARRARGRQRGRGCTKKCALVCFLFFVRNFNLKLKATLTLLKRAQIDAQHYDPSIHYEVLKLSRPHLV